MHEPNYQLAYALHRFHEAQKRVPSDDGSAERAAWQAVSDILRSYISPGNSDRLPGDVVLLLAETIDAAVAGYLTPSLTKLIERRGARQFHPQERRDVEAALIYRVAVERGVIPDHAPTKTICQAYGVPASTFRTWRKTCQIPSDDPRFHAGAAGADEVILSAMLKAGARYRRSSRSTGAIAGRNLKQGDG